MNFTPKDILIYRSYAFSLFGKELYYDIIEYILDFTIFSINLAKERYSNVLEELNIYFLPKCGKCCKELPNTFYSNGFIYIYPKLRRSTHAICNICNSGLSTYSFSICEKCADIINFPNEFTFYHKYCPNFETFYINLTKKRYSNVLQELDIYFLKFFRN